MRVNARQQQILDQVRVQRAVSVQALTRLLAVSPITIRRDLEYLESQGALTRTHGGAMFSKTAVVEFAFLDRAEDRTEQKQAIARHLAAGLKPGMTVILDTGTTTLEVARALAGIPRLRVLTSSLAIAAALYTYDNLELVLLGGNVRHHSPDLSGPLTEENLRQFHTDVAILGADAVDCKGLYTSDLGIARISRAMIACATESWLAADSSKFSRRSFAKFADWSALARVVTDRGLGKVDREWVAAAGPRLELVPVNAIQRLKVEG